MEAINRLSKDFQETFIIFSGNFKESFKRLSEDFGVYFDYILDRKLLDYISSSCLSLNPKRCGLFGLLDMRGGRILPGLKKRSLTPSNAFLEQQTESHMKAEVFS